MTRKPPGERAATRLTNQRKTNVRKAASKKTAATAPLKRRALTRKAPGEQAAKRLTAQRKKNVRKAAPKTEFQLRTAGAAQRASRTPYQKAVESAYKRAAVRTLPSDSPRTAFGKKVVKRAAAGTAAAPKTDLTRKVIKARTDAQARSAVNEIRKASRQRSSAKDIVQTIKQAKTPAQASAAMRAVERIEKQKKSTIRKRHGGI